VIALVLGFFLGLPGLALAGGAAEGEHGAEAGHHEDPTTNWNWYEWHWGKDVKGGPLDDGKIGDQPLPPGTKEEAMPAPFLFMVINFLIVVFILVKYGAPAARKAAEDRSDQIKTALDEAARLRDQARSKLDEYTAKLSAADAEIKQMIDAVRADAEDDRKRVMAAAEAQAIAVKNEAADRIAVEIERARHALSREVAVAAAAAAEHLIRAKSTAGDQTTLVDGFIAELGATAGTPRERT
jgi:F-type H+-transporting ATPase subunit b